MVLHYHDNFTYIQIGIESDQKQSKTEEADLISDQKNNKERVMKLNQGKVFKFIRKQYQASEEVNLRKDQKDKIVEKEPRNNKSLPAQEERLRKNLVFFNYEDPQVHDDNGNQLVNTPRRRALVEQTNANDPNKKKHRHESIQFEKKLSRVMMPDNLQKIKFVKKLQNRLLSCLDKKKPHVYVKQLINEEALVKILGKNPRRLITKDNYLQKLDFEPESVKRTDNKQRQKMKSKPQLKKIDKHPSKQIDIKERSQFAFEESHASHFDIFKEPICQKIDFGGTHQGYQEEDMFSSQLGLFDLREYQYEPDHNCKFQQRQRSSRDKQLENEPNFRQYKPQSRRQRDQYDLRNLRVPRLDSISRKKMWKTPFIDSIQEVDEEVNEPSFIFTSQKVDRPFLFDNEPSYEKFQERGEERSFTTWKSESSLY